MLARAAVFLALFTMVLQVCGRPINLATLAALDRFTSRELESPYQAVWTTPPTPLRIIDDALYPVEESPSWILESESEDDQPSDAESIFALDPTAAHLVGPKTTKATERGKTVVQATLNNLRPLLSMIGGTGAPTPSILGESNWRG